MADGSHKPHKPLCAPPKGAASDRENAALLARGSGDALISELARQQALIPLSKNGPLVSNRPADAEGKHPSSLQRLDRPAPAKGKQRVTLIWKKQKDTLDTQATYFDSLDGDHRLLWDAVSSQFEGSADLTSGEHSGCLALSDCDLSADILAFHVQPLATGIQCITISMVKPEKPSLARGNRGSKNKDNKGAKREEEELQRIRELRKKEEEQLRIFKELRSVEEDKHQKSKEKFEAEIRALSSILERDKKQAASEQQLSECKREVAELRGRLEREKSEKNAAIDQLAGHRNGEKLRALVLESEQKKTEYQPQIATGLNEDLMQHIWNQIDTAKTLPQKETPVRDKDYVNMGTANQRSEYYMEFKELEKSKENLSKAKLESESYSRKLLDYLHGEKIALVEERNHAMRALAEANEQITKLKGIIRGFSAAPPIPPRSPAPLSRGADPRPNRC